MTLNSSAWYVRWFLWSVGIRDAFLDAGETYLIKKRGTNLCFFVRTTLVTVPLIILWHIVVFGLVLSVATWLPVYLFGLSGASVPLCLLSFALCIRRIINSADVPIPRRRPSPTGPSALSVFWAWIIARKRHICPLIAIES